MPVPQRIMSMLVLAGLVAGCATTGVPGAGSASAPIADRAYTEEAVSKQYVMLIKLGQAGDPLVLIAVRAKPENGRLVVCQTYFTSGRGPDVATAYGARLNNPRSQLVLKASGEPPLKVPTAGAPVHFIPPPPNQPDGELQPNELIASGRTSRCMETGRPWTPAYNRISPDIELAAS